MQPSANPLPDRTRSSDLALALDVGAQIVGKIGERFGEHLLGWEICRNLVCADRVRHEIRESNLPANNTEPTLI